METLNKEHDIWVERYRPQTLEDFIGNSEVKKVISESLENNTIQHLTLYGPPGCGKTTLAKIIVNNLDCDSLFLNASDERGIDVIRDKVKGFASSATFKKLKIIVLDEADFLTILAQSTLRGVIEDYSLTTRFILTCNYIERMIDPILSRCTPLKIVPTGKHEAASYVAEILDKEGVEYEVEDIASIINKTYPDLRGCINTLQFNTANKVLVLSKDTSIKSKYKEQVLLELKKKNPNWVEIRKIINNSNVDDFEELFHFLYETSPQYAPGNEGMVAIYINEYSFQAQSRVDKEINIMALIARLIELTKPQIL